MYCHFDYLTLGLVLFRQVKWWLKSKLSSSIAMLPMNKQKQTLPKLIGKTKERILKIRYQSQSELVKVTSLYYLCKY